MPVRDIGRSRGASLPIPPAPLAPSIPLAPAANAPIVPPSTRGGGGLHRPLPTGNVLSVRAGTVARDPLAALTARARTKSLGRPTAEPFRVDGHLARHFEGGGSYGQGSVLVHDPSGGAHSVINGFLETFLRRPVELGGQPMWTVLGRPLEDEHVVDGNSVQRFEHATLYWNASRGVWWTPDDLLNGSRRTHAVAHGVLATGVDSAGRHEDAFSRWFEAQRSGASPAVTRVYADLDGALRADPRPSTPDAVLAVAFASARSALSENPGFDPDSTAGAHAIACAALFGLAAHGVQNRWGPVADRFPRFMWDGRPNDKAYDKSWHLMNQAAFAYVLQYDERYGTGTIARDFRAILERDDAEGASARVFETYERTQGRCGAMVLGGLFGPADETPLYFPRPADLSPAEEAAWSAAVRLGDAHEFMGSDGWPVSGALTVEAVGANVDRFDPLAHIESSHHRQSGLGDPGVSRDITANRIGAWLGVMLFRDPTTIPKIPFIDAPPGPFATGHAITASIYAAEERLHLEHLTGPVADVHARLGELVQAARGVPSSGLMTALRGEVTAAASSLPDDELARFYANFSVRHVRFGARLPSFDVERAKVETFDAHAAWARSQPRDVVIGAIAKRIDEVGSVAV